MHKKHCSSRTERLKLMKREMEWYIEYLFVFVPPDSVNIHTMESRKDYIQCTSVLHHKK